MERTDHQDGNIPTDEIRKIVTRLRARYETLPFFRTCFVRARPGDPVQVDNRQVQNELEVERG